jgi:hypothetical protein
MHLTERRYACLAEPAAAGRSPATTYTKSTTKNVEPSSGVVHAEVLVGGQLGFLASASGVVGRV